MRGEQREESEKGIRMKVKFLGESDPLVLTHDKVYEVISIEYTWYRIVDETEEDYLYPPNAFEIVEESPKPPVID